MIWDVAAGVIIGGGALSLIVLGLREVAIGAQQRDNEMMGLGGLFMVAGIAIGCVGHFL